MYQPKVFIGSSTDALEIAKSVKKGLVMRGCGDVQIWNQGVFGLGRGFLETLLDAVKKYDFAVLVWSAADAVNSNAGIQNVPRDNVVFETGLFMGAMGRDRVFVVYDETAELKLPSDFNGITLAGYNGQGPKAAVMSDACKKIADAMISVLQGCIQKSGRRNR